VPPREDSRAKDPITFSETPSQTSAARTGRPVARPTVYEWKQRKNFYMNTCGSLERRIALVPCEVTIATLLQQRSQTFYILGLTAISGTDGGMLINSSTCLWRRRLVIIFLYQLLSSRKGSGRVEPLLA
jgi:hypothetical protein